MSEQYQDCTLEDFIEELAELGNQMFEAIELLEDDEVIAAYLSKLRDAMLPLWITREENAWKHTDLLDKWDELIGALQQRKLVGPYGDSDWNVEVEDE